MGWYEKNGPARIVSGWVEIRKQSKRGRFRQSTRETGELISAHAP